MLQFHGQGWDGGALLALGNAQASAGGMGEEGGNGLGCSWLPTCWDWLSVRTCVSHRGLELSLCLLAKEEVS